MKHILIVIIALMGFCSCGKDDAWSPEDDVIELELANPYRVVFLNDTQGDIFVESEQFYSSGLTHIESGETSNVLHASQPEVTVIYFGEGTHYNKAKVNIILDKNEIKQVVLTYPY